VIRKALIAVEAVLVGAFAADAVFGLTGQSRTIAATLAVAFLAVLTWDVRRV
jgi:hypothetical protein